MAKRFRYVSLRILALMIAYHLGANSAIFQSTGVATGIACLPCGDAAKLYVITDVGDCYMRGVVNWQYWGNIYGGVATQPTTWGKIKAAFKD